LRALNRLRRQTPFHREIDGVLITGHCLWDWRPGQSDLLSKILLQLKGGRPCDVWATLAAELWAFRRNWDPEMPPLTLVPAPSNRPAAEDHALVLAQALQLLVPNCSLWTGLRKGVPQKQGAPQKHQRGLSREKRRALRIEIAAGAAPVLENLSQKPQWVLVDDVVTTGATAVQCARALGLAQIEVWCLAQRLLPCDEGGSLL
jgi:predicted amidophosphoribosyltransferase